VGSENVFLRLSTGVYLTWRIQSTAWHQNNGAAVAAAENERLVLFPIVLPRKHYWQDHGACCQLAWKETKFMSCRQCCQ